MAMAQQRGPPSEGEGAGSRDAPHASNTPSESRACAAPPTVSRERARGHKAFTPPAKRKPFLFATLAATKRHPALAGAATAAMKDHPSLSPGFDRSEEHTSELQSLMRI